MISAPRDANRIVTLMGTSSVDGVTPVLIYVDPITHRVLVDPTVGGSVAWGNISGTLSDQTDLQTALNAKQATLVSGTTIKTINGASILAAGDLTLLTSLSGAVLTDQTVGQTIGATGARLTKLWVTDITVTNAITGSVTGNAATVTTNANLTGVITSVGNATLIASQTGTGTKFVVDTSPTLVTPILGVAAATTINLLTITTPASGSTLTIIDGKTLTVNKTLTLDGTDTTTMTFPSTSATIARIDAAQTFTGTQTYSNAVIYTNNPITASGNAATVPVTARLNTVTNNSAATLTITMATASAVDGQLSMVRILDFSGVAQTTTWINTEDSTVTAPTTSNGSTTLFLSALFMYNGGTSKWRCIGKA